MYNKIRQDYNLKVLRKLVHAVMFDVDPNGFEARNPNAQWERRPKSNYLTRGTNFVHSMDGHDKIMGFQNSTFPLAIYSFLRQHHGDMDPLIERCTGLPHQTR